MRYVIHVMNIARDENVSFFHDIVVHLSGGLFECGIISYHFKPCRIEKWPLNFDIGHG